MVATLECFSLVLGGRRANSLRCVLNKQILQRRLALAATDIAWPKNNNPFSSAGISQQFSYNVITPLACAAHCCRLGATDFQVCSVPRLSRSGFGITSKIESM